RSPTDPNSSRSRSVVVGYCPLVSLFAADVAAADSDSSPVSTTDARRCCVVAAASSLLCSRSHCKAIPPFNSRWIKLKMEKSQDRRHPNGSTSPGMPRRKAPTPRTSIYQKREAKELKKEAEGGLVRFLPRSMSKTEEGPRRKRSASTSPSAWALSPGRSLSSPSPEPEKLAKREARSGVSGVLKYFRQKKVSPLLEEEYHQYRLMYNRLLQWRFANARAESSMANVNRAAQGKLLNGLIKISMRRKLRTEKRCEIEKLKQGIKLVQILRSEMGMLNEWCRIEGRNMEAVGRVVRKLSAISLCVPLVQDAQADVMAFYDAISTATQVMGYIEESIMDMYCQVEKTCFLVTELSVMLKQYKQLFQELENPVLLVASLEVRRCQCTFSFLFISFLLFCSEYEEITLSTSIVAGRGASNERLYTKMSSKKTITNSLSEICGSWQVGKRMAHL
ncbi:QWRF motif-containing protein 7-like, partial [Salvia splendens]|uniref:QWRF motif-containing protein 7-like n=1 Tax=Salvia splendens TaxID=180675 RepID=UPI001C272CD0